MPSLSSSDEIQWHFTPEVTDKLSFWFYFTTKYSISLIWTVLQRMRYLLPSSCYVKILLFMYRQLKCLLCSPFSGGIFKTVNIIWQLHPWFCHNEILIARSWFSLPKRKTSLHLCRPLYASLKLVVDFSPTSQSLLCQCWNWQKSPATQEWMLILNGD